MSESSAQQARKQAVQDLTGTTVGRFVIHHLLGAGGMGQVYRAEDTRLKRPVALKRMAPQLSTDEHFRRRFLKEAECASRLSDQHIAGIYDVFEEGSEVFLVMEYVDGETLRERLRRPIALDQLLEIAAQCASALVVAQGRGIVHRDLKPENIMLTTELQVKILDFGVARLLPHANESTTQKGFTSSTGMAGTPAYMAPEMLLEREADARSDIFSLGVTLYEAFTGQHPFLADTFLATAERILHHVSPPVNFVNPKAPEELGRIVNKMMCKDPAERYATSADLLVDLRAAQRARSFPALWPPSGTPLPPGTVHTPLPSSAPTPAAPPIVAAPKKRNTWIWLGLALLGVVGVGGYILLPGLRRMLPARAPAAAGQGPAVHETSQVGGPPTTTPTPAESQPAAPKPEEHAPAESQPAVPAAAAPALEKEKPTQALSEAEGAKTLIGRWLVKQGLSKKVSVRTEGKAIGLSGVLSEREHKLLTQKLSSSFASLRVIDHIETAGVVRSGAEKPGAATGKGEVKVSTDVTGARVLLTGPEGPQECRTPCRIGDLPPGRYEMEVTKDGYRPVRRILNVRAAGIVEENHRLEPVRAGVVITSQPPQAEVFVGGQRQPELTPTTVWLAPGTHAIALQKTGYGRYETSLDLKGEELYKLNVKLGQQPGAVSAQPKTVGWVEVRTVPPGADILVEGASTGHRTPFRVELPAGQHTLTFYLKGYPALTKTIVVEENQTVSLNLTLSRP